MVKSKLSEILFNLSQLIDKYGEDFTINITKAYVNCKETASICYTILSDVCAEMNISKSDVLRKGLKTDKRLYSIALIVYFIKKHTKYKTKDIVDLLGYRVHIPKYISIIENLGDKIEIERYTKERLIILENSFNRKFNLNPNNYE